MMKRITVLLLLFWSFSGYSQLALETFENPWLSTGPVGWTVRNESGPAFTWVQTTLGSAQTPAHNGSHAAYLQRENLGNGAAPARDWLITPYFPVPANAELRFFSRLTFVLDQGSVYKVLISSDPDPENWAAYQELQVWDELTLNPQQTEYVEKIVDIPPTYTGSVHIAFVMQGNNMDRWLLDDVKVSPKCVKPANLAASAVTLDSASLNWDNPSGSTAWEIALIAPGETFAGVGQNYNGNLPYPAIGLEQGAEYKYYVRSLCDGGGESDWSDPFTFKTPKVGDNCTYPLNISLPFVENNKSTANYDDTYDGNPGSNCNAWGTFLDGNDVVYTFVAAADGFVNITLTDYTTYTGVFVYTDCLDIGVNCYAGDTGSINDALFISNMAVSAGTTYYVVLSTWYTANSTPYSISIQPVYCESPGGLTASLITANTATLSWDPAGASAWEYTVQAEGSGFPVSGQNTTSSNFTVDHQSSGSWLLPALEYEYYVRASCGNGQFSPWAGPYKFTMAQVAGTLNYFQDFEASLHGWTLSSNQKNKWVSGLAATNDGNTALYVSQDKGVTNTYDFGTQCTSFAYKDIELPAQVDQLNLSFDWRFVGDANDRLRVWVVPVSYNLIPGNNIYPGDDRIQVGQDFKGQFGWTHFSGTFNATQFAGQSVHLVLEWYNDGFNGENPGAAVDNIALSVVTCSSPTNLSITTASNTEVTYGWDSLTSVPASYDYYFSQSPAVPTASSVPTGNVPGNSASITSLTPGQTNYFWVRSSCQGGEESEWTGPVSFITPSAPQSLDYTEDFEAAHGWTMQNGNQANTWVVGTALSNGGTKSLYITDDGGTTNHYNTEAASVVHAYKDIAVGANVGELFINFDWSNIGDYGDDMSVWLVPVWYTPLEGIKIADANIGVSLIQNLRGGQGWTHYSGFINSTAYAGSSVRLVIQWRNDEYYGNQPPGAIDNFVVTAITCAAPIGLPQASLTDTTATVTWTGSPVISPQYDYYISYDGSAPAQDTVPTGTVPDNTLTIDTAANTIYDVWVRSNCGPLEHSYWVGPVKFITAQIAATVDFQDDFEGIAPTQWTFVNDEENKWVLGEAVSNSPSHSIYISNNGTDNVYGANDYTISMAYRDIIIPADATELDLSFDWSNNGSPGHTFRIWITPTSYQPEASNGVPYYLGFEQLQGDFYNQTGWSTKDYAINAVPYQGTTIRLVFEWTNDYWSQVNNPPAAIDNIHLSLASCPRPINLDAQDITPTSAGLVWEELGDSAQWEVYVSEQYAPMPDDTATVIPVNEQFYNATLEPLTNYQYFVRAICSPGDKSGWAGPFNFNTPIGNDNCATPTALTVNADMDCLESTNVIFMDATNSIEPNGCSTQNGGDVWYEFTATNTAHNIELSHFDGNVLPVVIELYEGDQCGSLTHLSCSYTNYLTAVNLVPGITYKIRLSLALDNAYQSTSLDICITTPPAPTNNNPAQCAITTINADFEQPEHAGDPYNPQFVHHDFVQGWRTTAPDSIIEFWPDTNFMGFAAYSGHNFVELNANYASGLYQDYTTPQPIEFSYGFAHRGRLGEDTCILKAGPPDGPFIVVATKTTGTEQWDYVTGSYTTPANQPVTRFIFESGSEYNGDYSIGNFLDAISFTANNGILSVNPLALDCVEDTTTVVAAGIGQWSAHDNNPSITVIADASANTTTIAGFEAYGTYRYDWTTQYCTSTLEINYGNLNIPLPGVADVSYCQNETPAALTATVTATNTLNWYSQETGGMASAIAPTPDTAVIGTTAYYVSQSSAVGCEGPRALISVTVNEIPQAPITQDLMYCQNETAVPLTATSTATNTLNWYSQATGGTPSAIAPIPDTAVAGLTDYYVSQSSLSGCESPRMKLSVTVNPVIVNVTSFTLPQTICTNAANPVVAKADGFTEGGTFTAQPQGLAIDSQSGAIDLESSAAGSYEVRYTIAADASLCNPGASTGVTLNIVTDISVVTGFDYDPVYCFGSDKATPTLTAGFTTGGVFTAGTGLVIDPLTGEIDPNASTAGSYTVSYTIAPNAAVCNPGSSHSDTVVIGADLGFALMGDCKGSSFIITVEGLDLSGEEMISYDWKTGDGTSTGRSGEVFDVSEYVNSTPGAEQFPLEIELTLSSNGCLVSQTYIVDDIYCAIQRGISPNGDNMNDYFDLESLGVLRLAIFNRYGKEVYTRTHYQKEWYGQDNSGNDLPTGTYFYMIELPAENKTGWIYINREN